jgi:hypothetical protein
MGFRVCRTCKQSDLERHLVYTAPRQYHHAACLIGRIGWPGIMARFRDNVVANIAQSAAHEAALDEIGRLLA